MATAPPPAAAVAVVVVTLSAPAAAQDARELWEAGGDASIDRSPDWRPHSAAQTSLADWKLVDNTPPSADDLNRVDSVLDWLETARAERRWARQDDGDAAAPPRRGGRGMGVAEVGGDGRGEPLQIN